MTSARRHHAGNCAILRANERAKHQIVPAVVFANDGMSMPTTRPGIRGPCLSRTHLLCVLVHFGGPGADGDITVLGSRDEQGEVRP